jgi:hypothetical protein
MWGVRMGGMKMTEFKALQAVARILGGEVV